jgi:hypothetical protein
MSIEVTEKLREDLETALNTVVSSLGKIQIGTLEQFPYGWRKAAKGRTVWRILEEAIVQNLEAKHKELNLAELTPAASEVGIYDFSGRFNNAVKPFYVNIKSAVIGARSNKDDISKADKLIEFFDEEPERKLFIATFIIKFEDDMSILVKEAKVMPTMWLPDIYVNPSNNGNLQSSKYKALDEAIRRTNSDFILALKEEINVAKTKKAKKTQK